MAVYTSLGGEDLAALIAHYDVGDLVSAKGIAEGISNSNWLIETRGRDGAGGRFILTMYERRIDLSELPFFLALLDHLAARGCAVPAAAVAVAGAASAGLTSGLGCGRGISGRATGENRRGAGIDGSGASVIGTGGGAG